MAISTDHKFYMSVCTNTTLYKIYGQVILKALVPIE